MKRKNPSEHCSDGFFLSSPVSFKKVTKNINKSYGKNIYRPDGPLKKNNSQVKHGGNKATDSNSCFFIFLPFQEYLQCVYTRNRLRKDCLLLTSNDTRSDFRAKA